MHCLAAQDYEQALAKMLQRDAMFYGGTIAFAPYEFSADRRLYAPYYSKKDGALEFMYIERSYDYTHAEQSWYVDAMASGSRWSKPYFDESVGDILMTTYSAVVYRNTPDGQRQATAVVTIDIAIQTIGDAVKRFGLGSNGYAEIVTHNGIYLYSPEQSRVLNRESLFDNSRWARDQGFARLQSLIETGETAVVELYDPLADEYHWVSVAAIAGTPWHILGNFADIDADPRTPELRHRLMFIILGAVLLLCAVLLYKQPASPVNAIISWPTAILVSLVLAIGVSQIWRVAMKYSSDEDRDIFAVTSTQAVAREIRDYNQRAIDHLSEKPLLIPTGIYIESMKFLGSSDIRVVGGIWQKFDMQHQGIERGVVFPGATRVQMGEPIVIAQGDTELVRWQFSGEWRFNHHNARYPLVKDVFGIGIFPRDIGDNILMLPDVDSYPYLAPSSLPGLSPDVFLLGWNIKNTYFELRPWRHKTTFGLASSLTTETLPELHFSPC